MRFDRLLDQQANFCGLFHVRALSQAVEVLIKLIRFRAECHGTLGSRLYRSTLRASNFHEGQEQTVSKPQRSGSMHAGC